MPAPLLSGRARLIAVALPAMLAGSFEFLRHGVLARVGMGEVLGNLITTALALLGGLFYFNTVSGMVTRLVRDAERAAAQRLALQRQQALADDLHDSILQTLFFLNVRLKSALHHARDGRPEIARDIAGAVDATEQAYLEVRDTVARLRQEEGAATPPHPDGSLERLAATVMSGSDVKVTVEPGSRPPQRLHARRWAAVQAILLEGLRNARKHAAPKTVRLWVSEGAEGGSAGVEDDGVGFADVPPADAPTADGVGFAAAPTADGVRPPSAPSGGFGLAAMRRRASAADLVLDLTTAPGRGTRIEVQWTASEGEAADVREIPGPDRR